MQQVACNQLFGESGDLDGAVVAQGSLNDMEVDIKTLPDDTAAHVEKVLHQRMLRNNPMRMAGKKLVCAESSLIDKDENSPGMLEMMSRFVPILSWLPKTSKASFQSDFVAGLTVGVMAIPQSMSYANIAGLQYVYGLYSACIPTLIYGIFGQSRQLAVGPVAMVSLLVEAGLRGQLTQEECPAWDASSGRSQAEVCPEEYAKLAFLASALVGVMQILASVLRLGFLVSFLGHPVISGFTSGAAIIIGLSQLKYILGFNIEKSQFVYVTIGKVFENIGETNGLTLLLGSLWIFYLLANRSISRKYKRLSKLGPMGPLISCVIGVLLLWLVVPLRDELGKSNYVGPIPSGMIPFSLFDLNLSAIPRAMPTAISACLIGYMESIAIGKGLAGKHGYSLEAGQELLALGAANLVGAMFSSYPVTGSFSRSAVNNQTGAVSQLSGIITALVMLCTMLFLTPIFYYLPKFVLAAIVISSVLPLVAYGEAIKLWRVKRIDFVLWLVAFAGTLFLGVLPGILVAVGVSLLIVISESVRPQISILWRIPGTTIYRSMKQESSGTFIPNVFIARIGSSMYFANAAYIKDSLLAFTSDLDTVNKTKYLVLEMTGVVSIDSSAAHAIHDIVHDFRAQGIEVAFAMVGNRVEKTLRKAGVTAYIGEQWFFHTVNEAVLCCVRHQRAEQERGGQALSSDVEQGTVLTVLTGNEVGFSNQLHHDCTAVFISLAADAPMAMSEVTATFKRNGISVVRAAVDPLPGGGAKHTYFVQGVKSEAKLKDWEVMRLRQDLPEALARSTKVVMGKSPLLTHVDSNRVQDLAESLAAERKAIAILQKDVERQSNRLDGLVPSSSPSSRRDESLEESTCSCYPQVFKQMFPSMRP
eukprot:CAMPEP_0170595688 /NCGR_PEP_ID=MMETSP0224-20130122/14701_1 /TAXON_ID=285029 /ORGANISM="Togula jolla, Strain CCCM 725" /LENGTH=871 /DNA_ID=CAMNT_0010919897 /DNA_START=55 /DNA_END=2670 /DNA_ORIENTATION=-